MFQERKRIFKKGSMLLKIKEEKILKMLITYRNKSLNKNWSDACSLHAVTALHSLKSDWGSALKTQIDEI